MVVQINKLNFGYSKKVEVLHDLDFGIDHGEIALITGANGAGKSTILKLLNGILKPDSGHVMVDGLDTRTTSTSLLASHIAVTFQNPADQIFAPTVRDEILFGPKILRRTNPAKLTDKSIELFHLGKYVSKHPYDLSPAHRKLLTIASAVATDSPILAFDEPTASLSQPERLIVLEALAHLRSENRTLLIVSHDLEFFVPVATKLVVVSEGKIVYRGKPIDIVVNPGIARSAGLTLPLALRLQNLGIRGRLYGRDKSS